MSAQKRLWLVSLSRMTYQGILLILAFGLIAWEIYMVVYKVLQVPPEMRALMVIFFLLGLLIIGPIFAFRKPKHRAGPFVPRPWLRKQILATLEEKRHIGYAGMPGSGKTAFLRDLADTPNVEYISVTRDRPLTALDLLAHLRVLPGSSWILELSTIVYVAYVMALLPLILLQRSFQRMLEALFPSAPSLHGVHAKVRTWIHHGILKSLLQDGRWREDVLQEVLQRFADVELVIVDSLDPGRVAEDRFLRDLLFAIQRAHVPKTLFVWEPPRFSSRDMPFVPDVVDVLHPLLTPFEMLSLILQQGGVSVQIEGEPVRIAGEILSPGERIEVELYRTTPDNRERRVLAFTASNDPRTAYGFRLEPQTFRVNEWILNAQEPGGQNVRLIKEEGIPVYLEINGRPQQDLRQAQHYLGQIHPWRDSMLRRFLVWLWDLYLQTDGHPQLILEYLENPHTDLLQKGFQEIPPTLLCRDQALTTFWMAGAFRRWLVELDRKMLDRWLYDPVTGRGFLELMPGLPWEVLQRQELSWSHVSWLHPARKHENLWVLPTWLCKEKPSCAIHTLLVPDDLFVAWVSMVQESEKEKANAAETLVALGANARHKGNYHHAEILLQEAIQIIQNLLPWQQVPGYAHALALAHEYLGITLRAMGNLQEAVNHYQEAIQIIQNHLPWQNVPEYAHTLAAVHEFLGIVLHVMGNLQDAVRYLQQAIQICDTALRRAPGHTGLQRIREEVVARLQELQ